MSSLRFLVDVNVGMAVADGFRSDSHDVVFVGDLDWRMADLDMVALAYREGRIIVTMYADFGDLVFRARRPHAEVLLLRMPGAGRDDKLAVVREIISSRGDQLAGHVCVYRQGRLRVRG